MFLMVRLIASPPLLPLDTAQCLVLSFLLAVLIPCFEKNSIIHRGIFFLHLVVLAQSFVAPRPPGVDNISALYTNGVLTANLAGRYLDRLYTVDPEKEFRKIGKDGTFEDPSQLPFWRKLCWSFELFAVTRGIGWNWRIRGIPKVEKGFSKRYFISSQMIRWIGMYAGLWFVGMISSWILSGFHQVRDDSTRRLLIACTSNTPFLYLFIVLGWAMTIYSHFAVMILPLSVICVGFEVGPEGWQRPDAWPPNFGSLREAYSIRRFWGFVHHPFRA